MIALLEREREEGRELRLTLTLEPCTNAWTLVVGLRCCRRSVSRSVSRFGGASVDIPAPADITAHQPPVDPASHDHRTRRLRRLTGGLLPNIGALHSGCFPVPIFRVVVTHRALPFYRYPSRELFAHLETRCRHLVLPPARCGGNRLLRGIVLEMWLDLELNCGSNFGSTAP